MAVEIKELHGASTPKLLNEEWFLLENTGEQTFSTMGCSVSVGKGKGRLRQVGTLEPGFSLAPNQKMRVVTGSPAKKAFGKAPDETDDVKNYYLFLNQPLLKGEGSVVGLVLRQMEVARATYSPKSKNGLSS